MLRLALVAALVQTAVGRDDASDAPAFVALSACAGHGFDPSRLACGTCALVARALGAAHASASACTSCCSSALDIRGGGRFDAAEVRVCRPRAAGGLAEWLEKAEAQWAEKGVAVVDGACAEAPSVVLSRDADDGGAPVHVPVGAWRQEDISAFLEASLVV